MEWKGQEIVTIGDLMHKGIDQCDTPEEAQDFMKLYQAENVHAAANVGYVSGYYPQDQAIRIRQWFNVERPIFGNDLPSIEQALKAGQNAVSSTSGINDLVDQAHQNAIDKGWYEEPRTFGEVIALMHSELSEALEDHRNGRGLTELYFEGDKPCGIPTELADTIIRIFDFCGHVGINLEHAIREKMEYNATRPIRHGGKKL